MPVRAGFSVSGDAKNCEKFGSCAFDVSEAISSIKNSVLNFIAVFGKKEITMKYVILVAKVC